MDRNFFCVLGNSDDNCACFQNGHRPSLRLQSLECALKHENTRSQFVNFLEGQNNSVKIEQIHCYVRINEARSKGNKKELLEDIVDRNFDQEWFHEGIEIQIQQFLRNEPLKMDTMNKLLDTLQRSLENDLEDKFKEFVKSKAV